MAIKQLDLLTPAELIILNQHLKLGIAHLRKHLEEKDLKELLDFLTPSHSEMARLSHSEVEIAGTVSLVLNSIITATFGAWMGYFGFWGFSLASPSVFAGIVAIATIVGAFIGYLAVRNTKQQAKAAINNEILCLLQIEVLKKIEEKRKEEIAGIYQELDDEFTALSQATSFEKKLLISPLEGKSKNEISKWEGKVQALGEEKLKACFHKSIPQGCSQEWMEIETEFKESLISFFAEKGDLDTIHESKQTQKFLPASMQKLISTSPAKSVEAVSWIRKNARSLIAGLAPTLMGGFSSLSVYLGGVPSILKTFGHDGLVEFFAHRQVKQVEFCLALVLTMYFGFSFLYANRKAFYRAQELEKKHAIIIKKEAALTLIDVDIIRLKEVKRNVLELVRFFNVIGAAAQSAK